VNQSSTNLKIATKKSDLASNMERANKVQREIHEYIQQNSASIPKPLGPEILVQLWEFHLVKVVTMERVLIFLHDFFRYIFAIGFATRKNDSKRKWAIWINFICWFVLKVLSEKDILLTRLPATKLSIFHSVVVQPLHSCNPNRYSPILRNTVWRLSRRL
jgi:hypothetical protein